MRKAEHYSSGTIFQIIFCMVFAVSPWLSSDNDWLNRLINSYASKWGWSGFLGAAITCLAYSMFRPAGACRKHALVLMCMFWASNAALYMMNFIYTLTCGIFMGLSVMCVVTIYKDSHRACERKRIEGCENGRMD